MNDDIDLAIANMVYEQLRLRCPVLQLRIRDRRGYSDHIAVQILNAFELQYCVEESMWILRLYSAAVPPRFPLSDPDFPETLLELAINTINNIKSANQLRD